MYELYQNLPPVEVTLRIARVALGTYNVYPTLTRVDFAAFHGNGTEICFNGGHKKYPIHIEMRRDVIELLSFNRLLPDESSLVEHLTRFYEHQVAGRIFTLLPYFTEQNLQYCLLAILANHSVSGLTVYNRGGVVDWLQLYPKHTRERCQVHQLINQLGRERQQRRRFYTSHNYIGV